MDAARGPQMSLAVRSATVHAARPEPVRHDGVNPYGLTGWTRPAQLREPLRPAGGMRGPACLAGPRFATTKAGWVMCSPEDSPSGLWRSPGTRVGVYSPSGVQIPYPPPQTRPGAFEPGPRFSFPRVRSGRLGSIATVTGTTDADVSLRVLVYSNDAATRGRVMSALGTRPHRDLPRLDYLEVATGDAAVGHLDAGGIDLAILDGEAAPTGGMGLAKQLRDELDTCPPLLVLIGRADDRWLADWSRADASVAHPIDPLTLRDAVNDLLTRARSAD